MRPQPHAVCISVGYRHSLVLTADGCVYSFGARDAIEMGALGLGLDAETSLSFMSTRIWPRLVEALRNVRVCAVAAGHDNSVALGAPCAAGPCAQLSVFVWGGDPSVAEYVRHVPECINISSD